MCLGVPGKVTEVTTDALGMAMGKVSFGGIQKEVCFAYVPDAAVGDYVLVHVGFALAKVDEAEAERTLALLEEMEGAEGGGESGAEGRTEGSAESGDTRRGPPSRS